MLEQKSYKSLCKLSFTPNCLTTSATLLACGGQNGELHLSALGPITRDTTTVLDGPERGNQRPWSLTMTLPHTSINNSFLLLPAYTGNTPLPTRAPSPTNTPSSSSIHQNSGSAYARRSSLHPTSPDPSAQSGLGIATFPNSLPFGHDQHEQPENRPSATYSTWAQNIRMRARRQSSGGVHVSWLGSQRRRDDDDDQDVTSAVLEDEDMDMEGYQVVVPPAPRIIRSGFTPFVSPHQADDQHLELEDESRLDSTTYSGPATWQTPTLAPIWQHDPASVTPHWITPSGQTRPTMVYCSAVRRTSEPSGGSGDDGG